jgi:hypothetical protein
VVERHVERHAALRDLGRDPLDPAEML